MYQEVLPLTRVSSLCHIESVCPGSCKLHTELQLWTESTVGHVCVPTSTNTPARKLPLPLPPPPTAPVPLLPSPLLGGLTNWTSDDSSTGSGSTNKCPCSVEGSPPSVVAPADKVGVEVNDETTVEEFTEHCNTWQLATINITYTDRTLITYTDRPLKTYTDGTLITYTDGHTINGRHRVVRFTELQPQCSLYLLSILKRT